MVKKKKNVTKFNPVKEDQSGIQARRMIWSTPSLDLALKGLEQGRKLVSNPFYENNTKLLKGDLVFERTPEEIEEWKKCSKDILYFAEKYCKLMTPEGIKHIKLRGYQEKYLRHLESSQLSIYLACRQCGKCLDLSTSVKMRIDFESLTKDFPKNIVNKLKKSWNSIYYIKEEDCYDLPLFELYNLYDHSFKWKLKYLLYKLIYNIENYGKETKKRRTARGLEK